jgi:hypothetical protein
MQLDGQFAWSPPAVECPDLMGEISNDYTRLNQQCHTAFQNSKDINRFALTFPFFPLSIWSREELWVMVHSIVNVRPQSI